MASHSSPYGGSSLLIVNGPDELARASDCCLLFPAHHHRIKKRKRARPAQTARASPNYDTEFHMLVYEQWAVQTFCNPSACTHTVTSAMSSPVTFVLQSSGKYFLNRGIANCIKGLVSPLHLEQTA